MISENRTFMDLCLGGEAKLSEIDDYVKMWHEGSDNRTLDELFSHRHTVKSARILKLIPKHHHNYAINGR